jgi:hypothetical protein
MACYSTAPLPPFAWRRENSRLKHSRGGKGAGNYRQSEAGSSRRPPLAALVEPKILSLLHMEGGGLGTRQRGGGEGYILSTDPEQT